MLGPDPISVRGAKRVAPRGMDPALRRYLEREFLGGDLLAGVLMADESSDEPDEVETVVTRTKAGVWTTVKRRLFREPKRARLVAAPIRH